MKRIDHHYSTSLLKIAWTSREKERDLGGTAKIQRTKSIQSTLAIVVEVTEPEVEIIHLVEGEIDGWYILTDSDEDYEPLKNIDDIFQDNAEAVMFLELCKKWLY